MPGKGRRVGVVEGDRVVDITSPRAGAGSVLALIETCRTAERMESRARQLAGASRARIPWADLDRTPSPRRPHLLAPLDPPEVWGAIGNDLSAWDTERANHELVDWLARDNPLPAGTVLSTGTGILVPDEYALRDGDVVEIELEKVGTLRNRV